MNAIKENLKKEISIIKEYIENIVNNKNFYIPLIIFSIISYGFSLFNRTLFLDDLAQDVYYGSFNHKLKAMRWGQWVGDRLFSTIEFTPFVNKFIGLIFLVLTVIVIGSILYYFDNRKDNVWKYSLFSCIFFTYPLISEYFGFFEALTIPLQFLIVSFVLLYEVVVEKSTFKEILFEGFLLSFVMSGYESLIFVYITEVFIVLFIKYVLNNNNKSKTSDWIKEGFSYAIPLFVALALKYIIGYSILLITGLSYAQDGNTSIHWITDGFMPTLIRFIFNGYFYVLRGLSFLPITEFVVATIIFVILVIKHQKQSKHSLLIGFFILLSLFALSLLNGDYLGYRQTQSIQLFIAYVIYLLFDELDTKKIFNISVETILIVLVCFISLRQSICMHTFLALDNQRSDNERYIAQTIGYKIYSEFDKNKTVVFSGLYDMGEFINSQIYPSEDSLGGKIEEYLKDNYGYGNVNVPYTQNDNVFSVFNWAYYPFYGQTMYGRMLSYYGFDVKVNENMTYDEVKNYTKIAEDNNMKPFEIRDMGSYILVYLGPATEYTNWYS